VDVSVQWRPEPTRDVLVTRDAAGEREFSGFGRTTTDAYADCFIAAEELPGARIAQAALLVTGTLGLAYPVTGSAMNAAVAFAKAHGTKVRGGAAAILCRSSERRARGTKANAGART
jgi:fructokinase